MSKPGDVWCSPDGRMELRCGRWQDVLADVGSVDAVIADPPYSQRSEDGFRSGTTVANRTAPGMGYDPLTEPEAAAYLEAWDRMAESWCVVFGDHISFRWWETASNSLGRYTFPPVVIAKIGAPPRMSADGPGSHCEYVMVSRPKQKRFLSWGALRGWYPMNTVKGGESIGVTGAKHPNLMRAIVKDYSRPNDLICDPCAGGGTTLLAAAIEGRRAIGAEMDPETFDKAVKRLSAGYTPSMF